MLGRLSALLLLAGTFSAVVAEEAAENPVPEVMQAIITPQCWDKLVVQQDLDMDCGKAVLSKLAGYGIVVGASIVKVPQLINIVLAGSTEGLSGVSMVSETIGYTWTASYHLLYRNPLSTYGETLSLIVQNGLILLFMFAYMRKTSLNVASSVAALALIPVCVLIPWLFAHMEENLGVDFNGGVPALTAGLEKLVADPAASVEGVTSLITAAVNTSLQQAFGGPEAATANHEVAPNLELLLNGLFLANAVLFAFSRASQIVAFAMAGSTGNASIITTFLMTAGQAVRIFTTLQDVTGDPYNVVLWSAVITTVLNFIILAQFALFWGKKPAGDKVKTA